VNKPHAGRKRAVTLVGSFDCDLSSDALLKAPNAPDAALLEMKKGLLLDVGNIPNQFSKLNRGILDLCEACSEHIGKSKRLPPNGPNTPPAPKDSPVGKPASEFTSAEDYSFFVLLSIINNRIYTDIFRPFHPAASLEENDQLEEEYMKKIDTCMCGDICSCLPSSRLACH